MNDLSRLIYLADVVGALNGLCLFFSVFLFIATAICVIVIPTFYDGHPTPEEKTLFWRIWPRFFVPILFFFVAASIGTVLTPSKETVYAIAASEIGEDALRTPVATKAFKAIEVWLDKQIAKTAAE